MSKRTILTIILVVMCYMNLFEELIVGKFSYGDLFALALREDSESLPGIVRALMMAPTVILAILSLLHILEPKLKAITRNHLAIAGLVGFVMYLLLFVVGYTILQIGADTGNWLNGVFGVSETYADVGITDVGLESFVYPFLFLSYVLVHRFMRYDTPEA